MRKKYGAAVPSGSNPLPSKSLRKIASPVLTMLHRDALGRILELINVPRVDASNEFLGRDPEAVDSLVGLNHDGVLGLLSGSTGNVVVCACLGASGDDEDEPVEIVVASALAEGYVNVEGCVGH